MLFNIERRTVRELEIDLLLTCQHLLDYWRALPPNRLPTPAQDKQLMVYEAYADMLREELARRGKSTKEVRK